MEQEIVEKIRRIRPLLAAIIAAAHPDNDREIEAIYILCQSYDIISKIDPDKLGQFPLPETDMHRILPVARAKRRGHVT